MSLDTFTGTVDVPIPANDRISGEYFFPPNGTIHVGAGQAGRVVNVVMLIDPVEAADPTKSGMMECLISDDGGITFRSQPIAISNWVGGDAILTNKLGDTMDPPRIGFNINLSEVLGKDLRLHGVIPTPCKIGLGHQFV
jgi:hypothetical protein